MADESQVVRGINWRDVFPFTHIFRAFRVAIHPSKLLLGLLLLVLLYAGGRLMDLIWADKHSVSPSEIQQYNLPIDNPYAAMRSAFGAPGIGAGTTPDFGNYLQQLQNLSTQDNPLSQSATATVEPRGVFITFFDLEVAEINAAARAVLNNNWLGIGEASVIQAVANFVYHWPAWFFHAHPLFAILFAVLFLVLWSVFGGAVARIAAIHVARDEKISVRQALRFSTSKVLSFLFAPVIPILILLAMAALLAVGGLLLYVSWIGPITVGALFPFALATAFVMTLVLVGTVGGFNLMYPTVAVEGSDSFDAISRSFSYVFARPWRTIFYSATALGYGALTYFFVRLFIVIMLLLAHSSIGWFLGKNHQPGAYWNGTSYVKGTGESAKTINEDRVAMWESPSQHSLTYKIPYKQLKWSEDIAASLIKFWVYLTIATLGAYVISFYFSSNTIIYYLLRREVDATDLDDVYVEQADEDFAEATPEPAPAATATTPPATPASTTTSAEPTASASVTPATPTEPPPSNPPTTN